MKILIIRRLSFGDVAISNGYGIVFNPDTWAFWPGCQMRCPIGLDFPCLDVSPFDIAAKAVAFLSAPMTAGLARGDSGPRL